MNQVPSLLSHANLPGLTERLRLDKWLWAARFYKTRSLAVDDIDKGRIHINGQAAKASKELRAGDQVEIRYSGAPARTLKVLALSTVRGPAPQAQQLYQETPESIERRQQHAEQRRQGIEPADSLSQGRPTKRDRRQLAQWDDRWSIKPDKAP